MLALAKRQVVADRVDTLVKIGLGDLGKASNRYATLLRLPSYDRRCRLT